MHAAATDAEDVCISKRAHLECVHSLQRDVELRATGPLGTVSERQLARVQDGLAQALVVLRLRHLDLLDVPAVLVVREGAQVADVDAVGVEAPGGVTTTTDVSKGAAAR